MKKIILLGVAILAFVATGCNKENAENIKSNLITEMSISIEGSDTKVAVTPTASGLKYEWSGSESVWVFPAEAGQQTPILFSYILTPSVTLSTVMEKSLSDIIQ